MNTDKLYENSSIPHKVTKKHLRVVNRKKFNRALVITTLLITLPLGYSFKKGIDKELQTMDNMSDALNDKYSIEAISQYGQLVASPESLVDEDLFLLSTTLSLENMEKIFKAMGYSSADEFAKANGAKNFEDWYKVERKKYENMPKKELDENQTTKERLRRSF